MGYTLGLERVGRKKCRTEAHGKFRDRRNTLCPICLISSFFFHSFIVVSGTYTRPRHDQIPWRNRVTELAKRVETQGLNVARPPVHCWMLELKIHTRIAFIGSVSSI